MSDIIYKLNSSDHIIDIEGDWDSFAIENQGGKEQLLRDAILNTVIWQHLHGETQVFYQQLLQKLKLQRSQCSFPIRCDAPHMKRKLQLHLKAYTDQLIFESIVLEEQPRNVAANIKISDLRWFGRAVFVCSFCNLMRFHNGKFVELEELLQQGLFDAEEVRITRYNCICPDCSTKLTRII